MIWDQCRERQGSRLPWQTIAECGKLFEDGKIDAVVMDTPIMVSASVDPSMHGGDGDRYIVPLSGVTFCAFFAPEKEIPIRPIRNAGS